MNFGYLKKNLPLLATFFIGSQSYFNQCKQKQKNTVYMWGNGHYQPRPDALLQFKNFIPKKMTNLPQNLIKLEFGQYYEAGIDDSSNLYIWQTQIMDSNLQEGSDYDNKRKNIKKLASNVKEVKFTTGYIWTLTNKNEVIQYPIVKQFEQGKKLKGIKITKQRKVDPLKGSILISSGKDHIVCLNSKGQVFAMGDDTYGQCGQADKDRKNQPPFSEKRITYPVQVKYLKNIKKVVAGSYHCLALDQSGSLYGWGSNSSMQLSHEQQFSQMNTPLIASFMPIKISKFLDNNEILDIFASKQSSMIISKNKVSNSYEVHSFGCNLKGQLGLGQIRHVKDITKINQLSNYVLKRGEKEQPVFVKQLSCGKNHCIALLNIDYVMTWGDNQHGQMGNKKRSSVYSPMLLRQFSQKNIIGVFAGENSSGVIYKEKEDKEQNNK